MVIYLFVLYENYWILIVDFGDAMGHTAKTKIVTCLIDERWVYAKIA